MTLKYNGKPIHPSITQERVMDAAQRQMFGLDNPGFCVACGNEQEGCEPDARHYECEECEERTVFGASELATSMI